MKRNWEININNPVQNMFMDWNWLLRNYGVYTGSYGGFLNLFRMKDETSQIEPEKVRQTFISTLKIGSPIIDSIYIGNIRHISQIMNAPCILFVCMIFFVIVRH